MLKKSVLLLILPAALAAHTNLEGRLDGVWDAQRLSLQATVTFAEAVALDSVPPPQAQVLTPAQIQACFQRYASNLAQGLHADIGGQALTLDVRVLSTPPAAELAARGEGAKARYQVSAAIPAGVGGRLRLTQDLLAGHESGWTSFYVVHLLWRPSGRVFEGPLSQAQALIADPGAPTTASGLAWAYAREGVQHILTGYDHLLFVSALTLAADSALNLLAVVGMFTLAHTLTLVLAVLGLAQLSPHIVEPGISASIVVVALMNLGGSRPGHAQDLRSWKRLLVAFGFGLFHGLGFAGGLLEAMRGLQGLSQGLALASFSVGVELGHLSVVIPLFCALKACRARWGEAFRQPALRWGSALIVVAGLYYLSVALQEAFAA